MRMTIKESAINDFNIIMELAKTKKPCLGNFINVDLPTFQIITNFKSLSDKRPKLNKLGIYCLISLCNTPTILLDKTCQQILKEYIKGISWDDLQYVAFIENFGGYARFHLIFNRVTLEGNLIDLNCLGATAEQYDILRKAYTKSQVTSRNTSAPFGCAQGESLSTSSQLRNFSFTEITNFKSVAL